LHDIPVFGIYCSSIVIVRFLVVYTMDQIGINAVQGSVVKQTVLCGQAWR